MDAKGTPYPQRIWQLDYTDSRTGMQVIEDVKTGNQPFGFSRALLDPEIVSKFCNEGDHGWCANRNYEECHCECSCHSQSVPTGGTDARVTPVPHFPAFCTTLWTTL